MRVIMEQAFTFHPIGVIRSPHTQREDMPCQAVRSQAEGTIEVDPRYAAGLLDIEGFSHIILIYVFDRAGSPQLIVTPFLDDRSHGVFATRHPHRPNPVGLSVVELLSRDGPVLHVRGLDVLDGTPLLDIKPYVPQFDHHPASRTGWLQGQEDDRPWQPRYP
jgi:tRNA-Thr(GGU) m(6)t(6)A37 methyltransferase TsaA